MRNSLSAAALLVPLAACGPAPVDVAAIEVWHGAEQRVGHLGDAQPDFNLMGVARGNELWLLVNGGEPRALEIGEGPWGFRRLGTEGHFNADIPIASLRPGENTLEVRAAGERSDARATITLTHEEGGASALPYGVDWSEVEDPQDVGQYVDGRWQLTPEGLLSADPLYDRLFLIGDRTWRDYSVRTSVTVHAVAGETGPHSGAPAVGVILRFAGHVVDPPRFPDAQPKWGFQPLGGILWLRWTGGATEDPVAQFYRGDRNESVDGPRVEGPARTYELRAECATDPGDPNTTVYRLRVWPAGTDEPEGWQIEERQTSETALGTGGLALVAHHVDVTFGDLRVE